MKDNLFVFDVESTSLFGVGFAAGALVCDRQGNEIDRFELMSTDGAEMSSKWVAENVLPALRDMPRCKSRFDLREAFFQFYLKHKDTCEFWGDCIFPVEAKFLSAIVSDDMTREFLMPYPLRDLSTIIPVEIDRAQKSGIEGLRKYHPFDDCRTSMFFLIEAEKIGNQLFR